MFLTSLFMGAKIRTMWMTPFYLFMGVLFLYIFQNKIIFKKIKIFFFNIFNFIYFFTCLIYMFQFLKLIKELIIQEKKFQQIVQEKWDNNFKNKIKSVIGDEWHAGNLSYHLKSRPKWYSYFRK